MLLQPVVNHGSIPALTESERNSLTFRLENLWNEMETISRNRNSDSLDVRRQNREFEMFAVFDRIPFKVNLAPLKKELMDTSRSHGVTVGRVAITGRSGPPPQIPTHVHTDDREFRLTDRHVTEELRLEIHGKGDREALQRWLSDWKTELIRIVEPVGKPVITERGWTVQAKAYRFHAIRFPRLSPRDPIELLPSWGRQSPGLFAKSEPKLWSFVSKIRKREKSDLTLAKPYQNRAQLLLNSARMSFFISKAGNG